MVRNRIKHGRVLVASIHGRGFGRRRQEGGRLKIRRRPGEDPTLGIGSPHDAVDLAEAMLESVSRQHKTDEVWASFAAAPLAGLLYAASPCGNGKGIAWVNYAIGDPDADVTRPSWGQAAEICRSQARMLADALTRIAAIDSRQRQSVGYVMREAITPWLPAGVKR